MTYGESDVRSTTSRIGDTDLQDLQTVMNS